MPEVSYLEPPQAYIFDQERYFTQPRSRSVQGWLQPFSRSSLDGCHPTRSCPLGSCRLFGHFNWLPNCCFSAPDVSLLCSELSPHGWRAARPISCPWPSLGPYSRLCAHQAGQNPFPAPSERLQSSKPKCNKENIDDVAL